MKGAVGRLVGAVLRSRLWRANARLGEARGTVLAAGIAFYGFFSLFPLLGIGFAVLGAVVGGDARLQADVVAYVEQAVPVEGVFRGTEDGEGLVYVPDLVDSVTSGAVLGWAGVVAVGALLVTGLGWIAALRGGLRGVFRLPPVPLDPVRAKLLDLGVLLTLGLLVVVSAAVSVVANTLTDQILSTTGLGGSGPGELATRGVVLLTVGLLDAVLFVALYRTLADPGLSWRGLVPGAVLAAVGVGLLKLFAGVLLGGAADQPALAAFAVPVGLLVWLNLSARAILFGAAYDAVGPVPQTDPAVEEVGPARVGDAGAVGTVVAERRPVLPGRWADRAVLGAGVVLGISAAVLLHGTAAAARTVGTGVRHLVEQRGGVSQERPGSAAALVRTARRAPPHTGDPRLLHRGADEA